MTELECAAIIILAGIGSKTRQAMQDGNIQNYIDSNLFNLWSFGLANRTIQPNVLLSTNRLSPLLVKYHDYAAVFFCL